MIEFRLSESIELGLVKIEARWGKPSLVVSVTASHQSGPGSNATASET